MQPKTSNKYKQLLHYFFDWCIECGINPPSDPRLMDTLLSEYMEWLYQSDYRLSSANGAYYGLLHFYPAFQGRLPESEMTLRGWDKLHPGQSYPPLTWNLTCLIAQQLAVSGNSAAAVAVLLSFDCFLRIAECVGLLVSDVATPGDPRLGVAQAWTGIGIRFAKTGQNQWVQVTRPEVAVLLGRFIAGRPVTDLVFNLSTAALRDAFHVACKALDLYKFGFVPHSLRHGAASHDSLAGVSVEDIMRRGRWASGKSARIYIQSLRVRLMAQDIPAVANAKGALIASDLQLWLGL